MKRGGDTNTYCKATEPGNWYGRLERLQNRLRFFNRRFTYRLIVRGAHISFGETPILVCLESGISCACECTNSRMAHNQGEIRDVAAHNSQLKERFDRSVAYSFTTMSTKRKLSTTLSIGPLVLQWNKSLQEGEQGQMVGSIANRAITDLIREGNAEGLRNFLASRKSHVDDKDEVMLLHYDSISMNLL